MRKYFIVICIFILVLSAHCVKSQQTSKHLLFIPEAIGEITQIHEIISDEAVLSCAIRIKENCFFTHSYLIVQEDTFYLKENEDLGENGYKYSHLISFPEPVNEFKFITSRIRDSIQLFYIHELGDEPKKLHKIKTGTSDSCFAQPYSIIQDDWRSGLPAPDYDRIENEVHHIIIHHSATSNEANDYVKEIQTIYLYHTDFRGWSDIGYNYVIVPDGTIFAGRDPGVMDQDNVKGAHFCGANTGTMGICMLGTYIEALPTDTALHALTELLVWKVWKDKLNPFGYFSHPKNIELPVIAGHRDGCATECPGAMLYSKLETIRENVYASMVACDYAFPAITSVPDIENDYLFYPNPCRDILHISSKKKINSITVYSVTGQMKKFFCNPHQSIDFTGLQPGIYILQLKHGGEAKNIFIVKL